MTITQFKRSEWIKNKQRKCKEKNPMMLLHSFLFFFFFYRFRFRFSCAQTNLWQMIHRCLLAWYFFVVFYFSLTSYDASSTSFWFDRYCIVCYCSGFHNCHCYCGSGCPTHKSVFFVAFSVNAVALFRKKQVFRFGSVQLNLWIIWMWWYINRITLVELISQHLVFTQLTFAFGFSFF